MEGSNLLGRIRTHPQASASSITITKVIIFVMGIPQLAIGATYVHECPREPYIPIFLIVVGVFGLFNVLLSCLPCTKESEERTPNQLITVYKAWNALIILFLFGWVIAGNVWIYSIYEPNYDKDTTGTDPYCNKTLYLFAFWMTTLGYILGGLVFLCGMLAVLCFCLCAVANPDDDV